MEAITNVGKCFSVLSKKQKLNHACLKAFIKAVTSFLQYSSITTTL